jgi:hypothetical protein
MDAHGGLSMGTPEPTWRERIGIAEEAARKAAATRRREREEGR